MPSGQRWEKASESRIEYNSSRNKFHMRLLYTPKKQKTQVKRSPLHIAGGGRKSTAAPRTATSTETLLCSLHNSRHIAVVAGPLYWSGDVLHEGTKAACASRYNVLVQVLLQNSLLVHCCIHICSFLPTSKTLLNIRHAAPSFMNLDLNFLNVI